MKEVTIARLKYDSSYNELENINEIMVELQKDFIVHQIISLKVNEKEIIELIALVTRR